MINAPVEVLRERYGGNHNDVLSVARDKWNAEGETEVLATFAEQGVEPAAVKEIVNWCTGHFNNALGDPANVENIVALESEFRPSRSRTFSTTVS